MSGKHQIKYLVILAPRWESGNSSHVKNPFKGTWFMACNHNLSYGMVADFVGGLVLVKHWEW